MRYFALALALFLPLAHNAHAASVGGELLKAPATVKVHSDQGALEEYNIVAPKLLNSVYATESSLALSFNDVLAMCGDSLGELAEDFSVTLKQSDGAEKTVTVHAASKGHHVSVFGMCSGNSRDLTQLQFSVEKNESIEIR